jgi:hypothetical protein
LRLYFTTSWEIDLATFGMETVLNRRIASGDPPKFEFIETGTNQPEAELGFKEFLNDPSLSATAFAISSGSLYFGLCCGPPTN